MSKQDVFGFQVAVDDAMAFKQVECWQHLLCEAADEWEWEAFEFISFDELIQVHAEELGGDAEVAAEVEGLGEVDHAMSIVGIL